MLSAVVVNWNGAHYLRSCLDSLLAQEPAPDEVLLIDNHSDDESRDLVASEYPSVRVIDTGSNRGPAHARNAGVEAAEHELILLLDNDVVMAPGSLARLVEVLAADPRGGMVQARSVCGDATDVVHYDGAEIHFVGTLVLRNWFTPLAEATDPTGPVGAGIALCFLTKKSIYNEVGGFNERLFILYEDNEFSYKLRMRGYTISVPPDACCTHLSGTAGLSIRSADAVYPGQRTYLHSRNRWFVLLTCMRWRTFFLTMPAQLVYGGVYAVFGHGRGHVGDWWRGKWSLFKMLPAAVRGRRVAQRGRTVPDRELLVATGLTLNPGLADRGFKGTVRRGLDGTLRFYWRCVRWMCG